MTAAIDLLSAPGRVRRRRLPVTIAAALALLALLPIAVSGATGGRRRGGRAAAGLAVGASAGVVGGLPGVAIGAAAGSAIGFTVGILGGTFKPLETDPPYADAVTSCLKEKGYEVRGWE